MNMKCETEVITFILIWLCVVCMSYIKSVSKSVWGLPKGMLHSYPGPNQFDLKTHQHHLCPCAPSSELQVATHLSWKHIPCILPSGSLEPTILWLPGEHHTYKPWRAGPPPSVQLLTAFSHWCKRRFILNLTAVRPSRTHKPGTPTG